MSMNDLVMTSPRASEMLSHLPEFYATSRIMRSIMQAQGEELDSLYQALDEILNQYFVPTATWGLEIWERELGIQIDNAKPVDQRRSVILSKLRGIGTVTVSLIKSIAEAYDGGTVEVSEVPEEYKFTVTFVDTRGVPPNIDDLKAAIEEIKPAHLAVEYAFTYSTWGELKPFTWGTLKNYTWGDIKTRRWN
jgi:Uncharacterised protein conserved in bacteria (DUF2313)